MTNTYTGKINLFDCATAQKVIGQDKFLSALKTVLDHGAYCQGPETRELEEKLAQYSGTKYCATCASGTDALTLALMAWGVKPGDAVFVSSFTFVASAECVALLGATPIFIDSDPHTYNMDPNDLQRAIDEVKKEVGMVIESIDNIEAAYKLKEKYNVEMPIVDEVYNVLYNGEKPEEAVYKLMQRDKKPEME